MTDPPEDEVAPELRPMQFGFPWIMAFTLACGVLFAAVAAAGESWLFVSVVSVAALMLGAGAIFYRVAAVERDQTLELRRRQQAFPIGGSPHEDKASARSDPL